MRPRPLAVLLSLGVLLGACSSAPDDSADPSASPSGSAPATTSAAPSEPAAAATAADLPDGVAARVGGTDIPATDLQARFDLAVELPSVQQQLEQADDPAPLEGQLRAELLSQLVLQEVVVQAAAAQGVEPTDDEIASERASMQQEAGGEDAFLQQMQEQAVPEAQLEDQLRASLALEQVVDEQVDGQGTESPTDGGEATPAPTGSATPDPSQQARQEFLVAALQSSEVVVDGEFGTWDPTQARVVPA